MAGNILKKTGRIILAAALLPAVYLYADSRAETVLSPDTVSAGEPAVLQIKLNGEVSDPEIEQIPSLPDAEIIFSGTQRSFSWVNGKSDRSVILNFTVVPSKKGTLEIPSIVIRDGNEKYLSDPVRLLVRDGGPAGRSQSQYGLPGLFFSPGHQAVHSEHYADSRVETSASSVYPGEPVIVRYFSVSDPDTVLEPVQLEKRPSAAGFFVQQIKENIQPELIHEKNRELIKRHVMSCVMIPAEAGERKTGEISLIASVSGKNTDSFFDFFSGEGRNIRLVFKPADIKVLPLPDGKPADFSGNTGSFSMDFSAPAEESGIFEEVRGKIKISGSGNFLSMAPPVFHSRNKNMRAIVTEGESSFSCDGKKISGFKEFDVVLIPEESGSYEAGFFSFDFFNTDSREYSVLKTAPVNLTVSGTDDEEVDIQSSDEKHGSLSAVIVSVSVAAVLVLAFIIFFSERKIYRAVSVSPSADLQSPEKVPEKGITEILESIERSAEAGDSVQFSRDLDFLAGKLSGIETGTLAAVTGIIKDELYRIRFGGGFVAADDMKRWAEQLKAAGRN